VFLILVAFVCWVPLYFHASLLLAILRLSKFLGFRFQYASNAAFHREKNIAPPPKHFSGCLQFNASSGEESDDLRRTNRKEPRLLGFSFCIILATATKQKEEMEGLWKGTPLACFELTSLSGTDHNP